MASPFDHQHGVVLTDPTPKRFHIHTIVRTPSGNDYGMELLWMHYAQSNHHGHGHSHDHSHGKLRHRDD
ncbi:DUF3500 domain-containing protein [Puniceibacterium sp. IMCC21224]|uniref:DUF3500 domain-containing protein n=1 Tax=Puniceibacterium sp. IMCC21224 TaxID=1618204 RepID=UPI00064D9507|nr:DUF3500 domain-containing protein [Puniceibacterium sp. IMCC21224]